MRFPVVGSMKDHERVFVPVREMVTVPVDASDPEYVSFGRSGSVPVLVRRKVPVSARAVISGRGGSGVKVIVMVTGALLQLVGLPMSQIW